MSTTKSEIAWYSKYQDVVKELHNLRIENDKLQNILRTEVETVTKLQNVINRLKVVLNGN